MKNETEVYNYALKHQKCINCGDKRASTFLLCRHCKKNVAILINAHKLTPHYR
jgi:ribosomal protein S14